MVIEPVSERLTVCKVTDYSQVDLEDPFCFTGRTDQERSLVCRTASVPANTTEREDGWRAFRISGVLDFSLIGILSGITGILADQKIGVFAISTFNTDYILVKEEAYAQALSALKLAGYEIKNA